VREHLVGHHLAQAGGREVGGVDRDVGDLLQRREQRALFRDRRGHASAVGQRVAAARLLVAVDKDLLGCLEEQQPVRKAALLHVGEHLGEALEVGAAADVAHDRRLFDLRPLVGEQLGERADHLGRQVVDAEVAGVLEAGHRLRLAGAREAGDHHEVVHRRRALRLGGEPARRSCCSRAQRVHRILFTYS
jgi:hypothetical protein